MCLLAVSASYSYRSLVYCQLILIRLLFLIALYLNSIKHFQTQANPRQPELIQSNPTKQVFFDTVYFNDKIQDQNKEHTKNQSFFGTPIYLLRLQDYRLLRG